jgi:hypothetical protein
MLLKITAVFERLIRIPAADKRFSSSSRLWDIQILLLKRYWVSFRGVKRAGRAAAHLPQPSAEVKVE